MISSHRLPASCERKLASAARRLRGAIAREKPRARLVADVEHVRRAHLGVIKARTRVADGLTPHDDVQLAQYVKKLEAAARAWQAGAVDEIIAMYRGERPRDSVRAWENRAGS